jgi:peptidoglycan/LPS O-acetylase OafA/YrhL
MNPPAVAPTAGRNILREIEGLRALAVISVLLYHAHLGVPGGYVGVDVFFVVSGFLITDLLVRERQAVGRTSLAGFYARRVRRLLPAATLVLVAIVVGSAALLSPLRAHDTAVDASWAAGFLANVHFAHVGTDYLASSGPPSLLQHWWSLAIEEQFYLVWPGLLLLAWKLRINVEATAAAVCGLVAAASFAISWRLIGDNPVWGYFAPWSRAWELAVGGLCAVGYRYRTRLPWRALLGWLGLAAVIGSAFTFDESTTFPGVAALAPVLGTSALILSIGAARSPGRLLWAGPLQWIGGISYGIYLWHWPLLVVAEEKYQFTSAAWRGALLALSVGLAALTYYLLENPVRHLPALLHSAGRSLAVGAALVAVALGATWWVADSTSDVKVSTGYVAETMPPTTLASSITTTAAPAVTQVERSSTTTTTTPPAPLDLLRAKVADELQPMIAAAAQQDLVPENIAPAISDQHEDRPRPWADGCLVGFFEDTSPTCEFGDLTSDTTIALFGDSHVDQWFPATEAAAHLRHWKVVVMSKSKCTVLDLPVLYEGDRAYPTCKRWREKALARVLATDVDVVVITHWRQHYHVLRDGSAHVVRDDQWRAALTDMVTTLRDAGKKVLLLGDTPFAHQKMDECIAAHPRTLTRCHFDRASHVVPREMAIEQEVAAALGVTYYDTNQWFCANERCPAVVGNLAVYLDPHHINNTYGLFLAPYMDLLLQHMLAT